MKKVLALLIVLAFVPGCDVVADCLGDWYSEITCSAQIGADTVKFHWANAETAASHD